MTIRRPAKARGRRDDVVPLDPEIVALLRRVCPAHGPLWPVRGPYSMRWWAMGARMIRRDLQAAGIPYTLDGRVFDFHSLRGQLATDLDRAGVTLQRAQNIMRHATPTMTAKHYTRPEAMELAGEIQKLGRGRHAANLGVNLGVEVRGTPQKTTKLPPIAADDSGNENARKPRAKGTKSRRKKP